VKRFILFFSLGIILIISTNSWADIPKRINFQGVLKDTLGNPVPDGNYSLTFRIYDSSGGGNILWQEGQLVSVRGGIFTLLLGSAIPIPESVFNDSLRWVGVQVGSDPEISPRRQLVSSPYAYVADFAQNAGKLGGTDESNFVRRIGPDSVKTSTGNALKVQSSGSSPNDMSGIIGRADNSGANDAYGGSFVGMATGTGRGYGITGYGETNSPLAAYGANAVGTSTSTGPAYGGLFQATDLGTGEHYGVKAEGFAASNSTTYGLYGNASNTSTGDAVGGYFTTANTGTGTHYAVWGEGFGASSNTVFGVNGVAQNTSNGPAIGGYFGTFSNGTGGHTGVFGDAFGSSGATTYGVQGLANNTSSGGAYGGLFTTTYSGTGSHYAVYGEGQGASSSPAHGVFGLADNTSTGLAFGGRFFTTSSGTGSHYGVDGAGFSSSTSPAFGCSGYAENTSSGPAYGGHFTATTSGTGSHYGIKAESYGSTNAVPQYLHGVEAVAQHIGNGFPTGGYFHANSVSGTSVGLRASGIANSSVNDAFGVIGTAANSSTRDAYGGEFTAGPGSGYQIGVLASATGSGSLAAYGCYSNFVWNTSTGNAYAGYFEAYDSGSGTPYGVYGKAPVVGWASWAQGDLGVSNNAYIYNNLFVTGTKSAAVRIGNGEYRALYCMESPENWFEDFGGGKLVNGSTTVLIDPTFSQTVNTQLEYRVYLTPEGDCNGLYVANKTGTSFQVRELKGGQSNISFSYRIVAKRKGFENLRMATVENHTPEQVESQRADAQASTQIIQERQAQEKQRLEQEQKRAEQERVSQPETNPER
jgi:hypothetical protein